MQLRLSAAKTRYAGHMAAMDRASAYAEARAYGRNCSKLKQLASPRAKTPELEKSSSGGPHAGFALRNEVSLGWRNARAARISPDDVRIRQAVTASLRLSLRVCTRRRLSLVCTRPHARTGTAAEVCGAVSGTDPFPGKGVQVRHRPGPLSGEPLARAIRGRSGG